MYKDRITRWGLCKNIKKSEAIALIQEKAERDHMRKRTTIELHGQPVAIDRLLRHAKAERGSGKLEIYTFFDTVLRPVQDSTTRYSKVILSLIVQLQDGD